MNNPAKILTRRQSKAIQQQLQQQQLQATPSKASVQTSQQKQTKAMSQFTRSMHVGHLRKRHTKAREPGFVSWSKIDVENQLKVLEDDWKAFRAEHEELVKQAKDQAEADAHDALYDTTENLYLEARGIFCTRISELMPKPAEERALQQNKIQLEIPNAEIPNTWGTFAGSYSAWPSFRDRFKTVHDDPGLSTARKFDYLEKALQGPAANIRGNLDTTDANYTLVWNRLRERYEDDYRVVHELVQKILAMQQLRSPSCIGLRRIQDNMRDCLGRLQTYYDIQAWDPLLVFHVIDLLDSETRREWERFREKEAQNAQSMQADDQQTEAIGGIEEPQQAKRNAKVPTWEAMDRFLEQQAKYLAHMEDQEGANAVVPQNANAQRDSSSSRVSHQSRAPVPYANKICAFCQGPHPIFKCDQWYKETNLAGRRRFIEEKNLCHMCLKPNHGDFFCYRDKKGNPKKAEPCPRCPNQLYHNSALCPTGEAERNTAALASFVGPSTSSQTQTQSQAQTQPRTNTGTISKRK